MPAMLKDVESIIQCTKTIQALTLDENIDDLYANSEFDSGTSLLLSVMISVLLCCCGCRRHRSSARRRCDGRKLCG